MAVLIGLVLFVACILMAIVSYRLYVALQRTRAYASESVQERDDQIKALRRDLDGIVRVINTDVGGVFNRLSENRLVLESLLKCYAEQSTLVATNCYTSLIYHLHAVDQHTMRLALAVPTALMGYPERGHLMGIADRGGNDDLFAQAYSAAGLNWPEWATPAKQLISATTLKPRNNDALIALSKLHASLLPQVHLHSQGVVMILSGPSGTGKSTLVNDYANAHPGGFIHVLSLHEVTDDQLELAASKVTAGSTVVLDEFEPRIASPRTLATVEALTKRGVIVIVVVQVIPAELPPQLASWIACIELSGKPPASYVVRLRDGLQDTRVGCLLSPVAQ